MKGLISRHVRHAQIQRPLRRLSHLYPAIAEARASTLATLLYAIKSTTAICAGSTMCSNSPRVAAHRSRSTRTFRKYLYRVAGYRKCAGERAVRVDILERLADLIRPALAWRNNSPGIKPPGALDGTGFTVTVGMTSLVARPAKISPRSSFAWYRMERRPKPIEVVASTSR